ncbi:uncharacterized protein LOC128217046 [Mya arenaria]|uniref:uncharacterized protein LOC128217046 n=1 Tax=Mya arenaria TaxID=6604 RepID=UPI0022E2A4C8|nr:uncharacterized protein LOC128217046 [Mya arenaria]XP_052779827.1 uncharacterized protein LOC128217046 [Mya arenaria]XP_052779828.1 uncharacterized protein LOC128217046 [Mya arenaria]XP_052779829.1 uncharacterized protein LOC128217046 [Mya arenaria]XP_052779830.1 uncharacterized protein LOC128217046 [Mya arenaria]XP_052779831.1 uncharacterized protein LOC128217046 [Mya arenaria]XP_052779832.1 uncharacterized protein LOC128217046 [Mya arenaria]
MSETDQALDPIPVTKDIPVVNGNADIEPLDSDLTNGVSKPVMEMSNGVENNGLNGDHVEEDISEVPVNGDCENDPDINCADDGDVDLMGGDDLPPPPEEVPEIVPELPPPPPMADPQEEGIDSSVDQNLESSVDPVVDTNANPAFESSVDPEEVDDQCMDNNDELMNVSDNEDAIEDKESVDNILELPPRIVEDFSEEELVSDGGLEEESYVNVVNTQKQTGEEDLQSDCQLIEFGEAAPPVPPTVERTVPEQKEPEVEPAEPVESVSEPETIIPQISLPDEQEETAVEEDVQRNEISEQNEMSVEPKPEVPVQPEQVKEEEVPSQVEETVPVEDVPEPEPEQTQPQMGFSEPAIVVDNKPAEEEVEETPPPPPPPLVDETPAPPPPLDESIPLRRVSGGSSPSKDSSQSLESPTPMNQNVAVVLPQPETQKQEQEAAPIPKPLAPVNQEPQQVQQEIVPPPSQPVAVVAPQVHMEPEEDVSPPASPPGSPSTTSVGEIAEGEQISSPQVSQKINKKNFKNKIKFGTDLIEGSIKQLHFLKTVNNNPGLYEEWLFKKAIRRYEAFWLPLAAEHKKECLTAPWDIEWVWHCHMLAPVAYEADSRAQVGLLVDHKLLSEKDRTKALEKSRKYWHAKYPKEPFEIDLVYKEKVVEEQKADEKTAEATNANVETEKGENAEGENKETENAVAAPAPEASGVTPTEQPAEPTAEKTDGDKPNTEAPAEPTPAPEPTPEPAEQEIPEEDYVQKSSYDIFASITRQRVFFYQTSLSHFHDKHFLKAAQKRYQRFLFLKHQNSTEVLVPCYDIDLMWHTHMLHPGVYKHDTTKVLGQMLVHDDSVNNRAPGSTLVRADQKTRDLWKQHFDDTFTTFGAMFRGEPPVLCERMSLIDPEETYTFSTKKATVNLDRVQVEDLPEEVNKYSVKLAFGANEREGPMIKQFKGNKKKVEFENTKKGLAHFVFDTKEYDRINFNMSQQIGFACAGHDEELGQQMFNLMPVIEGIPMDKNDSSNLTNTVTIDVDTEHSLKATFSATIEPPKQGPTMLFMMPGNFETRICIMPEQILQMWGPIPLPRKPTGGDNSCVVATHKFVNHTGQVTFSCRLLHSVPLLMSAVQVFFQGRITAVGHLVGSDQVPLPSQLSDSKKIFSLNPEEGQRALLIKNQTGDWGLIRGQWTGFRKHQPAIAATKGKKAKKEVPWSPGTLSVSFYKCATGAWQHLTLPYQQENYKFNLQDAHVDLRTGTVEINSESNEVAENLALAFSVALLHSLCQPRYLPPPPPEPISITVDSPPASPPPQPSMPKEGEKKEEGGEGETDKKSGEAEGEGDKGEAAPEGAQAPAAPEEKPQETPLKTPKSPAKVSEPPTPSKKMKEIPAIPTYDLALILASGYNYDTPTNETIRKEYGANACAGCVAVGIDVGIGHIGTVADVVAETEAVEAVEAAEAADNNADHTDKVEAGQGDAGGEEMEAPAEAPVDMSGMEAMDGGAAACGAF